MGEKLGQLLLRNGLITAQQLDSALQAQLVFGGRLGTNLVELGYLSTNTLAQFLSRQLSMPSLAPSQLDEIPRSVIELIDAETAARFMVFPLALEGRTLRLAMADPTHLDAVDEIAFSTGHRVQAVVAPELLVIYALERFYDVKRASRFVRLTDAAIAEVTGQTAVDLSERAESTGEPREAYGLQQAVRDLAAADRHSSILEVLRRALADDFDRVVVFAVSGGLARAWGQLGCAIPPELPRDGISDPVRGYETLVEESRLLSQALRERGAFTAMLRAEGGDRLLAYLLGAGRSGPVFAVPVHARDALVSFAVASGPRAPEAMTKLHYYDVLREKLALAMDIVRLRKRIELV